MVTARAADSRSEAAFLPPAFFPVFLPVPINSSLPPNCCCAELVLLSIIYKTEPFCLIKIQHICIFMSHFRTFSHINIQKRGPKPSFFFQFIYFNALTSSFIFWIPSSMEISPFMACQLSERSACLDTFRMRIFYDTPVAAEFFVILAARKARDQSGDVPCTHVHSRCISF